jgi:hypothetical protein
MVVSSSSHRCIYRTLRKASHNLYLSSIVLRICDAIVVNNDRISAPAVGHDSGSGNGNLNDNSLDISLSDRMSRREEKKQEQV